MKSPGLEATQSPEAAIEAAVASATSLDALRAAVSSAQEIKGSQQTYSGEQVATLIKAVGSGVPAEYVTRTHGIRGKLLELLAADAPGAAAAEASPTQAEAGPEVAPAESAASRPWPGAAEEAAREERRQATRARIDALRAELGLTAPVAPPAPEPVEAPDAAPEPLAPEAPPPAEEAAGDVERAPSPEEIGSALGAVDASRVEALVVTKDLVTNEPGAFARLAGKLSLFEAGRAGAELLAGVLEKTGKLTSWLAGKLGLSRAGMEKVRAAAADEAAAPAPKVALALQEVVLSDADVAEVFRAEVGVPAPAAAPPSATEESNREPEAEAAPTEGGASAPEDAVAAEPAPETAEAAPLSAEQLAERMPELKVAADAIYKVVRDVWRGGDYDNYPEIREAFRGVADVLKSFGANPETVLMEAARRTNPHVQTYDRDVGFVRAGVDLISRFVDDGYVSNHELNQALSNVGILRSLADMATKAVGPSAKP